MSVDWISDYKPCPKCHATEGMGLSHNEQGHVCVWCRCGLEGPGAPAEKWSREVDIRAVEAWNNLDRKNTPMTNEQIEEIARDVYAKDRFTPDDEVWCNQHWLTKFARAIEASVVVKERERCIKRLLELVPMTDPDLTTDYLREELAK